MGKESPLYTIPELTLNYISVDTFIKLNQNSDCD